MCLKKKKDKEDNARYIIFIGLILTLIILTIIIWRYSNYVLPFCGAEINAEITSSYGTVVSAFLAPLWSGIAVWIYYLALKVQSKELKASQEAAFGQNLSFLISNSIDILKRLKLKGILNLKFKDNSSCTFLFICMKYCYMIMKEEHIEVITSLAEIKNKLKTAEEDNNNGTEWEITEREMEILAFNDPQKYFAEINDLNFNKYKTDFQYLLNMSKNDLAWKNEKDQEYCHIQDAFFKVWNKYGHLTSGYFISIENCINYLSKQKYSNKEEYSSWITSHMNQPTLALFYYYLYCQKERKRQIIFQCETLNFFQHLNKEQFLFLEEHKF